MVITMTEAIYQQLTGICGFLAHNDSFSKYFWADHSAECPLINEGDHGYFSWGH